MVVFEIQSISLYPSRSILDDPYSLDQVATGGKLANRKKPARPKALSAPTKFPTLSKYMDEGPLAKESEE